MKNIQGNHVLIVADSWEYIQFYLIDRLDLKVVLFQSPDRQKRDKKEICEEIHYLDLDDADLAIGLADRLHKKYNFKAVCSFTDEGVELASIIAKRLKLRHNPLTPSKLVNNKSLFREHLNNKRISEVDYILSENIEQLVDFISGHNKYPVILKPNKGAGSENVYRADNFEELIRYFNIIRETSSETAVLVEEFLDGSEISVETISFNGEHHIINITDKLVFNNVEYGHIMPSNISNKEEVIALTKKVLEAIDHKTGPCHIEIKLTSKGPKVVEAHTRPGGDFIVLLLSDVFNVDVISLTINYLISGVKPSLNPHEGKGAAVRYFNSPPGIIKTINGLEGVLKNPHVFAHEINVKVGDTVTEVTNSFKRSGCIVIKGDSGIDAMNKAEELIKGIRIITS